MALIATGKEGERSMSETVAAYFVGIIAMAAAKAGIIFFFF